MNLASLTSVWYSESKVTPCVERNTEMGLTIQKYIALNVKAFAILITVFALAMQLTYGMTAGAVGLVEDDNGNVSVKAPQLNAENFNTVDDNYKGISVGFNAHDFADVTEVKVELTRADGSVITKYGDKGVFSLISNNRNVTSLTVPFVIKEGVFKEGSGVDGNKNLYWQPGSFADWNKDTRPVNAKITVTDQHGSKVLTMGGSGERQFIDGTPAHPTYESIIPLLFFNPITSEIPLLIDDNGSDRSDTDAHNVVVIDDMRSSPVTRHMSSGSVIFAQVNGNGGVADIDTDDTAVLGTQSDNNDKSDVKGLNDKVAAIEPANEGWKFFGVPWYWTVLLVAAIGSVWYLFARRRNQDA